MKKFLSTNIFTLLFLIGIYLSTTGVSYGVFNYLNKPAADETISPLSEEQQKSGFLINTEGPKTEVCPINGAKFTKAERQAWERKHPLFVMIENHEDSRPQSGLSRADVVYEAVAEGGITRFGAVFYCAAQDRDYILGPVRSARTYFLDWASEYGGFPLYVHVGGANTPGPANALGQIADYGWVGSKGNDLNQFSIGFPTFWRDYERLGRTVATEHTMYSTTQKLWQVGEDRGWTEVTPEGDAWKDSFRAWKFADEDTEHGQGGSIKFNFWEGYAPYEVEWTYQSESNNYQRINGGQLLKDLNNDEPLAASNVVIQLQTESSANDGYENNLHLLYGTTGSGGTLIFQNGQVIKGDWVKKSRLDRTIFYDQNDKEISFVPGPIWIETLPVGTEVTY